MIVKLLKLFDEWWHRNFSLKFSFRFLLVGFFLSKSGKKVYADCVFSFVLNYTNSKTIIFGAILKTNKHNLFQLQYSIEATFRKLTFYRNFKSVDVQARVGYIMYSLKAPDEIRSSGNIHTKIQELLKYYPSGSLLLPSYL